MAKGTLVDIDKNNGRGAQLAPVIDVLAALKAVTAHQELCSELLGAEHHYLIGEQLLRRKAGWIRLRQVLHISVAVLSADRFEENVAGEPDWGWDFMVRATLPDGRFEEANGSASYLAMLQNFQETQTRSAEPTRHNVRSTALTRAKNRATEDLLGLPQETPDIMAVLSGYQPPSAELVEGEERSAERDIAEL